MRVVVALQAIVFEGSQHRLRMRLGMAVTALGYGRVLVFMAEGATEFAMLGLALGKHLKDVRMAGAAVFRRGVVGIMNIQWAVRFVAAQAIFVDHKLGMRFMAGKALVDDLMFGRMTEGTILLGVLAGVCFELFPFSAMAGKTAGNGNRGVIYGHVQGGMGIAVAAEAVL